MHQKIIRPFAGSSLLDIALRKIFDCKNLNKDNIYLGAYDKEIKDISQKVGVNIYDRSLESVSGDGTKKSLYEHVWHINSDYCLEINACNPMLSSKTIDNEIGLFLWEKEHVLRITTFQRANNYFEPN